MIGDILQPTHLIFILLVALIFLGPKRLPEAGRALGKGIRDFRGALSGITDDTSFQIPPTPAPTVSQAPASPTLVVTPDAAPVQPVASPHAQPSAPSAATVPANAGNPPAAVLTSSVTPGTPAPPAAGWPDIESTDPSQYAD